MRKVYVLLLITAILSIGSLVYGFVLTGAPIKQRDNKLDELRSKDMQAIASDIESYFYENNEIPQTLDVLSKDSKIIYSLTDPESKKPYEYIRKSNTEYSLCTIYKTEVKEEENNSYELKEPHAKGRVCDDVDLSALMYSSDPNACSGYYCGACKQTECGLGKQSGGGCTWDTSNNYCTEKEAGASEGEACFEDYQCESNSCQDAVCASRSSAFSPIPTATFIPLNYGGGIYCQGGSCDQQVSTSSSSQNGNGGRAM